MGGVQGGVLGGVLGGVFVRRFPFIQRLFRVLGWSVGKYGANWQSARSKLDVPTVGTSSVSVSVTFPDLTRHFFSSLTESVDSCFVVVLNR